MTDTEKSALEARIDELCAENERLRKTKNTMRGDAFEIGAMLVKARDENAKLREELDAAKHDLSVFSREIVASKAKNAKLRELVDYMTPIAWYAASERERDRMRELGIEVPDGEV